MRVQTILMGMDWSAAATDAWSEACLLANTFGSEVVLAHALPTSVSAAAPREREEVELRAHELLRDLSVGSRVATGAPRAIVDVGAAADVLLAATHEPPLVDLVVIGASERSSFGRALLGSTAERIVRESPAPVWLVRPGRVHQQVKRILCALDVGAASSESDEALRTAVFLCRTFVADLTVLTVVPTGADVPEGEAQLHARLETIDLHGITTHLLVRAGKAAAQIVAAAGEVASDLLVMGTTGRTGLAHLWRGSTAERVIRAVPSSVLVVKRPE
jgi:nucleotide-binding universal stress UspA family protein